MKEMSRPDLENLLSTIVDLLHNVNGTLRAFYAKDIMIHEKGDGSPVTEADHKSHDLIFDCLTKITPDIKIISEEGEDFSFHPEERFWLVDPLDGTRGFIGKTGHFCVNIALIENGLPTIGFIGMPLEGRIISAVPSLGVMMWEEGKTPKTLHKDKVINRNALRLIVGGSSRRLRKEYSDIISPMKYQQLTVMGSALKFCQIAEGESDIYIRLRPTYEWDTASGHAILRAMGGDILKLDKTPLFYGKKDLLNPGFIAVSDVSIFE